MRVAVLTVPLWLAVAVCACVCPPASASGGGGGLEAVRLRVGHRECAPSCFLGTPAPRFSWALALADHAATQQNKSQSAYRLQCSTRNGSFAGPPLLWDSGVVASAQSVLVKYGGAAPIPSRTHVYWRVQVWDEGNVTTGNWSRVAEFETALLQPSDWHGTWISANATVPQQDCDLYADRPAPFFRKLVGLSQSGSAVAQARLYLSGLGYYIASIGQDRIGDAQLDPGWTAYNQTVLYASYDVTGVLHSAGKEVVLGMFLGNGWWNPLPLKLFGRFDLRESLTVGQPMLLYQLEITYTDGATQMVTSDTTWKTAKSPLVKNDLYLGSVFDATLLPQTEGWQTPGFDDKGWASALVSKDGARVGTLTAQYVEPIRAQETLAATLVHKFSDDAAVFDMGRNAAARCSYRFQGKQGSTATMVYGELLFPNGTVNFWTSVAGQIKNGNSGPCAPHVAKQTDAYIFGSDNIEEWTHEFGWHGFRYVEIHGAVVDSTSVTCYPLRSDVAVVGSFDSSSDILNRVHTLAVNSQTSNMLSVQSDCPHRERLGYSGDALMSGEGFIRNFNMADFYAKRVRDLVQAQRPNGGYTEVAPYIGMHAASLGGGSGPIGWQSFGPAAVAWLCKYYGEVDLAAEAYDSLQQYVEFIEAAPESAILNGLGDWMATEHKAVPMTGLAFVLESYLAFANISSLLGKTDAAALYVEKAANVSSQINSNYLNASTGLYQGPGFSGTQCAQALPLFFQLVPPASEAQVVAGLRESSTSKNNQIQVGGFAIKWVLQTLADHGMQDLALAMMTSEAYPSFGYMMANNATTIWESWFFSDNVYSHNHAMFSDSEVWLYDSLGGITLHPGAFASNWFLIKPQPAKGLSHVNASIDFPTGTVATGWTLDPAGHFEFSVAVPPNTRADVWLPHPSAVRSEFVGTVGSGHHTFERDLPWAAVGGVGGAAE